MQPTLRPRKRPRRSPLVLLFLILLWGLVALWGLAPATPSNPSPGPVPLPETDLKQLATAVASISIAQEPNPVPPIPTVDFVPQRYQLGQEIYRNTCGTCHIALPPAVLPSETWRQLLSSPEHYGRQLQPLLDPSRQLVWQYLQIYSRPDKAGERLPYRVNRSRFFHALHPQVELPSVISLSSCLTCHPRANQYNFRHLSAPWQGTP